MTWARFDLSGHTTYDVRRCDMIRDAVGDPMAELLALRAIRLATQDDGFIPLNALDEIGARIPNLNGCVRALVESGVWEEREWGWWMDVGRSRHCRRSNANDRHLLTPALRRSVLDRDGHRCQACGATDLLRIDHIEPVAKGGRTIYDNLQVLCARCNGSKGVRSWDDFLAGR